MEREREGLEIFVQEGNESSSTLAKSRESPRAACKSAAAGAPLGVLRLRRAETEACGCTETLRDDERCAIPCRLRDASDAGPRSAFSRLDVDLLRLTAGLRVAASRLPSLLSPSWATACESGAGCTSGQEWNGNTPRSARSGGSASSGVGAGGQRNEEPVSRWCTRCARRPRSRGPAPAAPCDIVVLPWASISV